MHAGVMINPAVQDPDVPLTDDILLADRVRYLLRGAIRRQVWLLFLDTDDVQAPPVMPCADLPVDPLSPAKGGAERTPAETVSRMVADMMTECGFAQAVFVWERPGPPRLHADDRAWARALREACVRRGVRVRAQFQLYDGGVRQLAADDIA